MNRRDALRHCFKISALAPIAAVVPQRAESVTLSNDTVEGAIAINADHVMIQNVAVNSLKPYDVAIHVSSPPKPS